MCVQNQAQGEMQAGKKKKLKNKWPPIQLKQREILELITVRVWDDGHYDPQSKNTTMLIRAAQNKDGLKNMLLEWTWSLLPSTAALSGQRGQGAPGLHTGLINDQH